MFFIHFSVNGHLGCLHVLAIVKSAVMNIAVHVFFWITVLSEFCFWWMREMWAKPKLSGGGLRTVPGGQHPVTMWATQYYYFHFLSDSGSTQAPWVKDCLLQEPSPGLRLVQHGHSLGPIFLPRTGPSRYFKIKAPNTPYFATSSPMCFFFPVSFWTGVPSVDLRLSHACLWSGDNDYGSNNTIINEEFQQHPGLSHCLLIFTAWFGAQ